MLSTLLLFSQLFVRIAIIKIALINSRKIKLTYTFETISLETESRILYRNQCKLEKYNVRYELWRVHGLLAECITFSNDDVSDLANEELEQLVRNNAEIVEGSAITISRSAETTFVVFNLV